MRPMKLFDPAKCLGAIWSRVSGFGLGFRYLDFRGQVEGGRTQLGTIRTTNPGTVGQLVGLLGGRANAVLPGRVMW